MKYDMIFGNQGLFSVAPTDATAVWVDEDGGNFYYKLDSGGLHSWDGSWHNCVNVTDDICFSAMRRIIAEPKRWTWEDQKAGRLPEVGSHLLTEGNLAEFIGLSHAPNNWCFRRLDGEWGIQTANKDWFSPIETPAEKAQRLRDEWIQQSCYDLVNSTENAKELAGFIYDALLSGKLKIPETQK